MIDTHAHIYDPQFNEDIDVLIAECKQLGITRILMPNIDLDSVDVMMALADKYPGYCLPMMGLHPCSVTDNNVASLAAVGVALSKGGYVAVGEMGTDLYWDKTYWREQQEAFRIQCELGIEHDLPIVIHSRESIDETIRLVAPYISKGLRGVFHCFTGDISQGQRIMDMGFYMGIGGVVTFKNGGLDKVLPALGLSRLLLETDSPYLAPTPHRGKRNSPTFLPLIAQKISDILEISSAEVSKETDKNAIALFRLDEL